MDPATGQLQCRPGDEVISSDDHKLGKITAADPQYLTVEHGLLAKSHYYIPTNMVNACSDGKVYLNATKDQAAHAGWDVPPPVVTDVGNPPRVQP